MKANIYLEYQEKQVQEAAIVAKAKQLWKDAGNKANTLKSLQLYVKPEENAVYYVINDEATGSFSLDEI